MATYPDRYELSVTNDTTGQIVSKITGWENHPNMAKAVFLEEQGNVPLGHTARLTCISSVDVVVKQSTTSVVAEYTGRW